MVAEQSWSNRSRSLHVCVTAAAALAASAEAAAAAAKATTANCNRFAIASSAQSPPAFTPNLWNHKMATDPAIISRIETLESWKQSNRLPTTDGLSERNLAKTLMDMEIYVSTLISDPPIKTSNVQEIFDNKIKSEIETLIDIKLRTAMQFSKVGNRDEGGGQT